MNRRRNERVGPAGARQSPSVVAAGRSRRLTGAGWRRRPESGAVLDAAGEYLAGIRLRKQFVPTKWISGQIVNSFRSSCSSFMHGSQIVEVHSEDKEVVIALGSNVRDRIHNFNKALQLMKKSGIGITRHGCLYETEPAYVTDQPLFLNSAVRGVTKLGPRDLLGVLKRIEKEMGRTEGIRFGPRLIDLDILFYGKYTVNTDDLTIPHERIWERPFVMAPLIDLLGSSFESDDDDTVASWHSLALHLGIPLSSVWHCLQGPHGTDSRMHDPPAGIIYLMRL
ncbi:hypothetical protein Dimus_029958 [Dionaea muscipula]